MCYSAYKFKFFSIPITSNFISSTELMQQKTLYSTIIFFNVSEHCLFRTLSMPHRFGSSYSTSGSIAHFSRPVRLLFIPQVYVVEHVPTALADALHRPRILVHAASRSTALRHCATVLYIRFANQSTLRLSRFWTGVSPFAPPTRIDLSFVCDDPIPRCGMSPLRVCARGHTLMYAPTYIRTMGIARFR